MMTYQHKQIDGTPINLAPGKAVCIGRNYVDHIHELNNEVPKQPLLFHKPTTAFCDLEPTFTIPKQGGACHHELEVAILIGKVITPETENISDAIWGLGLALDLTLRELQTVLKSKGHPWEIAKGFDGSCPTSPFFPISEFNDLENIGFQLKVNDEIRQDGHTSKMITKIPALIEYATKYFTLLPGDVLLTGTPAGVDALKTGDKLDLNLNNTYSFKTIVA